MIVWGKDNEIAATPTIVGMLAMMVLFVSSRYNFSCFKITRSDGYDKQIALGLREADRFVILPRDDGLICVHRDDGSICVFSIQFLMLQNHSK